MFTYIHCFISYMGTKGRIWELSNFYKLSDNSQDKNEIGKAANNIISECINLNQINEIKFSFCRF